MKPNKYRSSLEKSVADLLSELGISFEYETKKVAYQIQHNYNPDFILPNKHLLLECKGYWEPEDRRKVKAVVEQNPDLDLRMILQDPYIKISKKSKTTYAQWCEKHGIKWTSWHSIPLEWLI